MKQKTKQSVLIAALLALGLAGCQKQEEAPAPEVMEPEAPAPQAPLEPMPEAPAPGAGSMPPASGDMPSTPPSQ